LKQYDKSESTLKKLHRRGLLPKPKRTPSPGGGSTTFYPNGTDAALKEFLSLQRKDPANVTWASSFPAILHLRTVEGVAISPPEPSYDLEEYQTDRMVTDIMYATDLAELRLLIWGSTCEADHDPERIIGARRLDQIDPRTKHLIARAPVARPPGKGGVSLATLLNKPQDTQSEHDEAIGHTVTITLGRYRLTLNELANLAAPPLFAWGLDRKQFLGCFPDDEALKEFQDLIRAGLSSLIAYRGEETDLGPEERTLRDAWADCDYSCLGEKHRALQQIRFIPLIVKRDAKVFALGGTCQR